MSDTRPTEAVGHVDGLAVTRLGEGNGPTVVVVHGTMDRSAAFRRSARRVEGLDLVLYDRRGYSKSAGSGLSPDVASQVADLSRVVHWASSRPVVLVGHSLGGLISAHLAIAEPDRVRAVGLWEPPLPWVEWYRSSAGERALRLGRTTDGSAAAEYFLRAVVGDRIWERMPPDMQNERLAEGPTLLADLDLCRRPEARFEPVDLGCPAVVGWGSESPWRFRRSAAMLLDEMADAEGFEVEGAGHGVHLTHPTEFVRFIEATVDRGVPSHAA